MWDRDLVLDLDRDFDFEIDLEFDPVLIVADFPFCDSDRASDLDLYLDGCGETDRDKFLRFLPLLALLFARGDLDTVRDMERSVLLI